MSGTRKLEDAVIIGADVRDQHQLRSSSPVDTVDECLAFLAEIEALFGPTPQVANITVGDRFLL